MNRLTYRVHLKDGTHIDVEDVVLFELPDAMNTVVFTSERYEDADVKDEFKSVFKEWIWFHVVVEDKP